MHSTQPDGTSSEEQRLFGVTVDEMSDSSFPASDPPAVWTWDVPRPPADDPPPASSGDAPAIP
jgi:hypothetical protein